MTAATSDPVQAEATRAPVEPPVGSKPGDVSQLSEGEMRDVLAVAGWPTDLHDQALSVACGIGNHRFTSGESACRPGAIGDSGHSLGLFQLNGATWAPYCGVSRDALLDAVVNASCAYRVYLYDIDRGQPAWAQWSVKP